MFIILEKLETLNFPSKFSEIFSNVQLKNPSCWNQGSGYWRPVSQVFIGTFKLKPLRFGEKKKKGGVCKENCGHASFTNFNII